MINRTARPPASTSSTSWSGLAAVDQQRQSQSGNWLSQRAAVHDQRSQLRIRVNVTLRDLTAGQVFANRAISSFSSTSITINPNFTTAAHLWSVEVINPNGQTTGQYQFNVVAPSPVTPVLSVTPTIVPVPSTAGNVPFNVSNTGWGNDGVLYKRDKWLLASHFVRSIWRQQRNTHSVL